MCKTLGIPSPNNVVEVEAQLIPLDFEGDEWKVMVIFHLYFGVGMVGEFHLQSMTPYNNSVIVKSSKSSTAIDCFYN